MVLIDGRKIRDEILAGLKARVAALPFVPVFCDVLVGADPVAEQYVRMKYDTAKKLGIAAYPAVFPQSITTDELVAEVQKIAAMPHLSGLIIQLPLPEHIDAQRVLDAVPPAIDVDVTTTENMDRFYNGDPRFIFPTAGAIMHILDSTSLDLATEKCVVLGQGMLVGKPVLHLLKARGYDAIGIDSSTQNAAALLKNAQMLITAIGKPGYIRGEMLSKHVSIIDAGTSEIGGGVRGDVDVPSVADVASFVSPTPGGVGPVTVAWLMQNIILAAERM